MALINCPECGQQVSDKAESCPSCGVGIAAKPEAGKTDQPTKEADNAKETAQGCAIMIVIMAALVWWVWPSGNSDSDSSRPRPEHSASGAYVMCQDFVEKRLRAPSTADFPWGYSDYVTDLGGGKYRVRAYVDAENAFGGTVRNSFDCTVKYIGNDKWRLETLDLN